MRGSGKIEKAAAILAGLALAALPFPMWAQTSSQGPLGGKDMQLESRDQIYLPADGQLPPGGLGVSYKVNDPEFAASMAGLIERFGRPETKRTFDPADVAKEANDLAAKLEIECKTLPENCARAKVLRGIASSLLAADSANPNCGKAARAFRFYYENGNPTAEVARNFDLACLGSFALRKTATGEIEERAAIPAVFKFGGSDPARQGAMGTVAILMVGGKHPFCAGLLRRDRKLMTARHCFNLMRSEFRNGNVSVRSADGRIEPIKVSPDPVSQPPTLSTAAAEDWIVLKLEGAGQLDVPDTVLVNPTDGGEVTLIAHYPHFEKVDYAEPVAEPWSQGLRYPRPGLCQILETPPGCVQVACQTVRGFSGAPVFQLQPASSGKPIVVIGFVSGAKSNDAQCHSRIPGQTALVSAGQFEQK